MPVDADALAQSRRMRLQQALELYRSLTAGFATVMTALTLALVTLIGLAINNTSSGIASIGAVVELLMVFVVFTYEKRKARVLSVAQTDEAALLGTHELTTAVAGGDGFRGISRNASVFIAFLLLVVTAHLVIVVVLVRFHGWSFSGARKD